MNWQKINNWIKFELFGIPRKEPKQETLEEHDKHCEICQGFGYGKKQEEAKSK